MKTAEEQLSEYLKGSGEAGAAFALEAMKFVDEQFDSPDCDEQFACRFMPLLEQAEGDNPDLKPLRYGCEPGKPDPRFY